MARRVLTGVMAAFVITATGGEVVAQQTIVLSNGDQLTGALVGVTDGKWVFKYAGQDLEIDALDVVSFSAPEPIGIRLADETIVAATVRPTAGGLLLQPAGEPSRTVAPGDFAAVGDPADLEALRPVRIKLLSPFFKFWTVTTSLGVTIKDGNTNTRSGTFYLDMFRATELDRLTLTLQVSQDHDRLESGELEQTAGKYLGGLRYDVFALPKLFIYGSTRQSRDRFKEIDLRSFYTAGLGYQFIQQPKLDLRSSLGAGVRHEKFFLQEGTVDSSSTVVSGSLDGSLRVVLGPFDYDLRAVYAPSLEDINDYQVVGITGLTARVIAGLGFRIQFLWEFDNTPTAGSEKHDTELTTALTYKLGG